MLFSSDLVAKYLKTCGVKIHERQRRCSKNHMTFALLQGIHMILDAISICSLAKIFTERIEFASLQERSARERVFLFWFMKEKFDRTIQLSAPLVRFRGWVNGSVSSDRWPRLDLTADGEGINKSLLDSLSSDDCFASFASISSAAESDLGRDWNELGRFFDAGNISSMLRFLPADDDNDDVVVVFAVAVFVVALETFERPRFRPTLALLDLLVLVANVSTLETLGPRRSERRMLSSSEV